MHQKKIYQFHLPLLLHGNHKIYNMITMDNQHALYRHDIISVKCLLELFDKTKTQLHQNFYEKIL